MENHPAMYWYHPHAHGSAAIQKGGGMAGIILIKDDPENVPLGACNYRRNRINFSNNYFTNK